ncbi:hypothetical protein B0H11DRAFT_1937651 [Mycena galericulata]|nr:hypothetical protein B0H11DRAFT_1937651 [Mycena galericulata]
MAAHTHRFIRWRASRFRALDDDFFGPRNGSGVRSQHPTGSPCSATVTLAARERLDDAGGITASEKHGVQLRTSQEGGTSVCSATPRQSPVRTEAARSRTQPAGANSRPALCVRLARWPGYTRRTTRGYPFQPAILLESCCKRRAQSCASNIVGLKCKCVQLLIPRLYSVNLISTLFLRTLTTPKNFKFYWSLRVNPAEISIFFYASRFPAAFSQFQENVAWSSYPKLFSPLAVACNSFEVLRHHQFPSSCSSVYDTGVRTRTQSINSKEGRGGLAHKTSDAYKSHSVTLHLLL